jgi:hypothetical protein
MLSSVQFYALGDAWVGGWGLVFFAYPERICRMFGLKKPTPKRVKLVKIIGGVELALLLIGGLSVAMFGLR